ncbi:MAG TPA: oxidoreductase [Ramlibacter sp.]|nr:oxidoreductase [Ramlibacter sp.]
MPLASDATWFITGCSSGFGRDLAELVLARGWRAVVTARDVAALEPLRQAHPQHCLPLALDVTDAQANQQAVQAALQRFGGIDVLVNNAGRGYLTAIEHARAEDIRAIFELNVFGLVDLTQRVLPHMRHARRGHILNVSSTGGLLGRAGSGFYAASKFAVEGFSEALAQEVAPFGIHVTLVEPSGFRTRFLGALLQGEVGEYEDTVGRRMRATLDPQRRPAGDPQRAAHAIVRAVTDPAPPLRLPLGADAVQAVRDKVKLLERDLAQWEQAARGADFPG